MYTITKIEDSVELLPDITNTSIWVDYDETECSELTKCIAMLYTAIAQRENYYQLNTPTAFGNPQYNYYCGVVNGILQARGMEEITSDGVIIIKKNNRKKLIIDKIKRPESYFDSVKDNNDTLRNLFG